MSSIELEKRQAEAGKLEASALMRLNERTYRKAILNPERVLGVSARSNHDDMTRPEGPELRTANRVWERLSSRSPDRSSTMSMQSNPSIPPREQAAIERHLERAAAVHLQQPEALRAPVHANMEQWVREAKSAEERAQRARLLAQAKHEQAGAVDRARLCVFKAAGGAATGCQREERDELGMEASTSAPVGIGSSSGKQEPLPAVERALRTKAQAWAKCSESMTQEVARLCVFEAATHTAAATGGSDN